MNTKTEILVVDDNIDLATILQDTLKVEGYNVMIAHDGKTAFAICQENRFDLALIDIKLPDMPGIELINKLAELSPKTEYIIITAYATMETAIEAVKQKNIVAYQTKPLDINQLLYFIKQVIERRQAKEALRESEEKYRTLAEESPVSVMTFDRDGIVTFVNKWHLKTFAKFKYGPDFFLGKKVTELPGIVRAGVVPQIEKILRGETINLENIYFPEFTGGHSGYQRIKGVPIYKENEFHGGILIREDVTERYQAGEKIRRLSSAVEQSIDGIAITDLKPELIYVNNAFARMHGYSPEEMIGMKIEDLHNDEQMDVFIRAFNQTKTEGSWMGEIGCIRKDGTPFSTYSSVILLKDAEGKPIGFEEVAKDIAEKKKLESQLRQAQKMEAIGTLAGGIAHDFNNILAAIIGFAELAKMRVPEDSEILPNLDQILKSGNRAKTLIQQILAFSRKQELEQKPLQLKYIVKESLKFLKSTLPTDIEIKQDIAKDAGIVNADPSQMQQVIMNLCTNAGHAMQEEGGVLAVGLTNVELDDVAAAQYLDMNPGPYLKLSVSDTGYGMTSDVKEQIFEPYFTTKEKGVGTGLGLSVVNGIIDSHGGTITVYSEPGKGSTFHVYLPLIQEGAIKPEIDEQAPILTGNERILFIDDEKALVDLGKQMLERLGYKVTTRTRSIEALEFFRNNPDQFDLVITDTTMPKMTGDKLAKELMKIRPDIPIIICTGYSGRISGEKAKEIGIREFVMKPFVMQDLAKTVRKVLDA